MRRRLWRVAALGITALIVAACLLPAEDLPALPGSHFDKLQHLVAFALLGLAWHQGGMGWIGVTAIAAGMALFTEGAQTLMKGGRNGDVMDVLADLLGVAVGILVSTWLIRRPLPPRRSTV